MNPVKDGLNLVAKEAPLVNERDGAVVLSREAGAYEELRAWVVGVDPLDVDETRPSAPRIRSRARSGAPGGPRSATTSGCTTWTRGPRRSSRSSSGARPGCVSRRLR